MLALSSGAVWMLNKHAFAVIRCVGFRNHRLWKIEAGSSTIGPYPFPPLQTNGLGVAISQTLRLELHSGNCLTHSLLIRRRRSDLEVQANDSIGVRQRRFSMCLTDISESYLPVD